MKLTSQFTVLALLVSFATTSLGVPLDAMRAGGQEGNGAVAVPLDPAMEANNAPGLFAAPPPVPAAAAPPAPPRGAGRPTGHVVPPPPVQNNDQPRNGDAAVPPRRTRRSTKVPGPVSPPPPVPPVAVPPKPARRPIQAPAPVSPPPRVQNNGQARNGTAAVPRGENLVKAPGAVAPPPAPTVAVPPNPPKDTGKATGPVAPLPPVKANAGTRVEAVAVSPDPTIAGEAAGAVRSPRPVENGSAAVRPRPVAPLQPVPSVAAPPNPAKGTGRATGAADPLVAVQNNGQEKNGSDAVPLRDESLVKVPGAVSPQPPIPTVAVPAKPPKATGKATAPVAPLPQVQNSGQEINGSDAVPLRDESLVKVPDAVFPQPPIPTVAVPANPPKATGKATAPVVPLPPVQNNAQARNGAAAVPPRRESFVKAPGAVVPPPVPTVAVPPTPPKAASKPTKPVTPQPPVQNNGAKGQGKA